MAVSWDNHASNINPATFLALREAALGAMDLDKLLAAAAPPPSGTARERFWSWVEPAVAGMLRLEAIGDLLPESPKSRAAAEVWPSPPQSSATAAPSTNSEHRNLTGH